MLRVLIVDDDAPARARVRVMLDLDGDIKVVGEVADGQEAIEFLADTPVDLVFLDVDMPKVDGFGVIAHLGERMPPVIFTTGYSEYAVRAFAAYAIDFLLKPFDASRFLQALERGRAEVTRRRTDLSGDPRITALVEHLATMTSGVKYPKTIAVKREGQYLVVSLANVTRVEADGNVAHFHEGAQRHIVAKSLAALATEVLDPCVFVRVHKSTLVNVRHVRAIEPVGHGDLDLVLTGGVKVACSRRYRELLEKQIALIS